MEGGLQRIACPRADPLELAELGRWRLLALGFGPEGGDEVVEGIPCRHIVWPVPMLLVLGDGSSPLVSTLEGHLTATASGVLKLPHLAEQPLPYKY